MKTGIGGPHTQITVTIRFAGHHGDLDIVFGNRLRHIAHVWNAVFKSEFLITLVNPIRLIGIVGNYGQFETRVRVHATSNIVVLHHTQNEDAIPIQPIRHSYLLPHEAPVRNGENALPRQSPDVGRGIRHH